ncbi:ribonucleases p/mrp subunit pop1 domain-containing protein [Plakobranchus ocellatus]|uniref:Ribonucleases p/mrp subunit pop1 domain-containing protein n=1 Tax=Plakobranchus ocellatus TaxID=259542 RepID=A0AAV3Z0Q0_9GAST|nr:ribonucleases p/mrp subunit pop1 domain-containing protein [Plakobranchus ocellatus]
MAERDSAASYQTETISFFKQIEEICWANTARNPIFLFHPLPIPPRISLTVSYSIKTLETSAHPSSEAIDIDLASGAIGQRPGQDLEWCLGSIEYWIKQTRLLKGVPVGKTLVVTRFVDNSVVVTGAALKTLVVTEAAVKSLVVTATVGKTLVATRLVNNSVVVTGAAVKTLVLTGAAVKTLVVYGAAVKTLVVTEAAGKALVVTGQLEEDYIQLATQVERRSSVSGEAVSADGLPLCPVCNKTEMDVKSRGPGPLPAVCVDCKKTTCPSCGAFAAPLPNKVRSHP